MAMATVVNRAGLRSSKLRTQAPVADVFMPARRMTEVAPTTSSLRRYPSPILQMRPRRSLPPEEFCLGTRPRNAANYRPFLKTAGSDTLAARAVAVITPTPGIVSSRRLTSSARCQTRRRRSSLCISPARRSSWAIRLSNDVRAISGSSYSSGRVFSNTASLCGPCAATMPNSAR